MNRFGTASASPLEPITEEVVQVLPAVASILGPKYSFGSMPPLERGAKPYTARADVAVLYEGSPVGMMVVLGLAPGDGTGNTSDYALGRLTIPSRLSDADPTRILPRKKEGFEIYTPLVTVIEVAEGDECTGVFPFMGSLELLTLDPKVQTALTKGWQLGLPPANYEMLRLRDRRTDGLEPRIELTTGYDRSGSQFGSPHAVYHNPVYGAAFQVAGFLAVRDSANPLWGRFAALEPPRPTWAEPLPLPPQPKH